MGPDRLPRRLEHAVACLSLLCPAQVQGSGAASGRDSQVSIHRPCPPGKADTGLQRRPLCSSLTVHAFSSPGSGPPARASRGQQRSLIFSLKEKMFQKQTPPWGGLMSVGMEKRLIFVQTSPAAILQCPRTRKKKKETNKPLSSSSIQTP